MDLDEGQWTLTKPEQWLLMKSCAERAYSCKAEVWKPIKKSFRRCEIWGKMKKNIK